MKCLDDCHTYALDVFMGETSETQKEGFLIHFYEMKENGMKIPGVTNEEVLSMLIHRLEALNKKMRCFENQMALSNLIAALSWLEARTENRIKRNVEGTHKP